MEDSIHTASRARLTKKLEEAKKGDFSDDEIEYFRVTEMPYEECIEKELLQVVTPKELNDPGNLLGIKPIVEDREFQAKADLGQGELVIAGITKSRLYNTWVTCYAWLDQMYLGQVKWVNTQRLEYFPLWVIPLRMPKKKKKKTGRDPESALNSCVNQMIAMVNAIAPTDTQWRRPDKVKLQF